ncbi:MAG TPA: hypothetical protein VGB28_02930 [Actinomycetota bacterium]|jgi:hypothetical protein
MARRRLVAATALAALITLAGSPAASAPRIGFHEYTLSKDAMCELRDRMVDRILATHEEGTWAPLEMAPSDDDLALMGLPSAEVLTSRRYPRPTMVTRDGAFREVDLPAVASFAGTGCFGIRPGAWLLLLNGGSIGWCSMAHVYGSPGGYDISTAGHCGKVGDTATIIAAFGNHAGALNPILLDFGTFAKSTDAGLGKDWALIDIRSAFQHLVTPTMCFWGGPRGMYTKTGALAGFSWTGQGPKVTVTPDPLLAQTIVHYGHGTGVGPGGTPRAGEAIAWGASHFMFTGVLTPGDSGSGSNTLAGDTIGATMEAAGINTHIYVDPLMRKGIGIMGGTRATQVTATLANGQIVPYPVPVSGLP